MCGGLSKSMKTLVTLGCSWTFGVGVGYDETTMGNSRVITTMKKFPYNYTEQEYDIIKGADYPTYEDFVKNRKNKNFFSDFVWQELLTIIESDDIDDDRKKKYADIAWDETIVKKHSFRGIISKSLDLKNDNFSKGGSSNDMQFNIMSNIFGDTKKREHFLDKKPIVLWGITSTARIFRNNKSLKLSVTDKNLDTNSDNEEKLYKTLYTKLYYDHDQEVANLSNQIELWNIIFEHYDVPVIWFDTFNNHKYPHPPRNFLQGGDLLTQMLNVNKSKIAKMIGKYYHYSSWRSDDPRIDEGIKLKLLNPISVHPTKAGHNLISQILLPHIKELMK